MSLEEKTGIQIRDSHQLKISQQEMSMLKSLGAQRWILVNKKHLRVIELFQTIEVLPIYLLNIAQNHNSNILNQISLISFPNLKQLYLNNNDITNIQKLSYLDCQNLRFLGLNDNKIRDFSSLRKSVFPKLKDIDIAGNQFSCFNSSNSKSLIQNLAFQSVKTIYIQYWDDSPKCYDFHNLIKIKSETISSIYLCSPQRLKQLKIDSQFRKKNIGIDIYKRNFNLQ